MTQSAAAHSSSDARTLHQWHPAFFATIQIEFIDDAELLTFENEHQLSKKPLEVDVLIVKKDDEHFIIKNIGNIFRKHNIFEYKGPKDYLNIDDFYKVYGYACIYKSDSNKVNEIKITEISISFVSQGYPRKLMKHLRKLRKFKIKKEFKGVYYVIGDILPIQFIVQNQLSKEENLWLKSLTDNLKNDGSVQMLADDYNKNQHNKLYETVMDMIIRSNSEQFKEAKGMCEALRELFKDELEEEIRNGINAELTKVQEEIKKAHEETKKAHESGTKLGKELGKEIGKDLINKLNIKLAELNRSTDIIKSAMDTEYQQQLLAEFNLV